MARLLAARMAAQPQGAARPGAMLGYRRALQAAVIGGVPVDLVSGVPLASFARGRNTVAGRSFESKEVPLTNGCALGRPVPLNGSFTSVALVTPNATSISQYGIWRSGSLGQGTTFFIFSDTRQPFMRMGGVTLFNGGQALTPGAPTVVAAVWNAAATRGAVWFGGIERNAATAAASVSGDTINHLGWQYAPSEPIGPVHGWLHFNTALPDALLARITASPAAFWAFAFNP